MKTLNELRDEALRIAVEHGFKDASVGEDIALMHSELSEALEDHRAGKVPSEMTYDVTFEEPGTYPETGWMTRAMAGMSAKELSVLRQREVRNVRAKPVGIPSEMADVVIRVLHFCGKHGVDIEKAVAEKMAFNNSRPFMHGGKKL